MSLNDFNLGKYLGKGSFGSVQIVERKTDNKKYAMKRVRIDKLSEKDKKNALNEIRLLASLKHKNIIGYKEAFFDENSKTLNIVMEYADDGDISLKIKRNLKKKLIFDENTIWKWLIQLLEGIKYLHDNKIMHRDLKSANLFLCKNGLLKIGDLNVSTIAKNDLALTQTGTPYYTSPEIWKEKPYNNKCDIWSAGCIIYEICTLHVPFRGTNFKELFDNISLGKYSDINVNYSDDLRKILKLMIVVNPDMRYDAQSILECDIVKKKIKELNFSLKDSYIKTKALLMRTIKLPKNMSEINNNLPKRYLEKTLREEEMMENDEYETVKQTFYKSIMNSEKNKEKNQIQNNNNNNNNKLIEGNNISNNLHKSNNSNISNNSNNIYNSNISNNSNNIQNSNISNNSNNIQNSNISNNSNQNTNNHRYNNNLINDRYNNNLINDRYNNNLINEKKNFNIKSDYYNKKTSNSTQGVENENTLKNSSNIIDYNKKNILINSTKSNSETNDNSKINIIDNNKVNNNNFDISKNNQQNTKDNYIYSPNKKMYINSPTPNPDKYNLDNQKKINEQFPIGNENKKNNINSTKINPINNNSNNNNNQINFIPSPKSNPIKIHRANTNINNHNKLNINNQILSNEKNNNPNQIKNEKSFPKKNRPESSNQKNQNNLLNYRQNRPQSVGMQYQILKNDNNMNYNNNNMNNNKNNNNNNNNINYNNMNYNNNMNHHNNNNSKDILSNKNYVNEYIEKEKELREKKKEINEMNKNIKLLDFRQNNNVNNINEGFKIKRSPSNPNPVYNPYLYNKGNNNNYPIFQYKKIQINPNRKVSYGIVKYKNKGNERHYYNIPIPLKYNNNINNIKYNNNNNFNYNKNKNFINNNNNKYIIEKFNNNNYGMKNNISRDGPRVIIRHELK